MEWVKAESFRAIPEGGQPRCVSLVHDHDVPEQWGHHQAYMLWSGLWVYRGSEATSPGVHRRVMLSYAAALEEAMKEGKWPLFHAKALAVPGTYGLSAPWKVAAVAAVLVQASGLGSERGDPAVSGAGGPGCLESARRERGLSASDLAVRWGESPGLLCPPGSLRRWDRLGLASA